MKIRNNYVLYINDMLKTAYYGNSKFDYRICNMTIGKIYDCSFKELRYNLNILHKRGYDIYKRNW